MVAKVTFELLDKIIADARTKNTDGTGGKFADQQQRKELKRLLGYAVKLGWLTSNPVDHIRPLKLRGQLSFIDRGEGCANTKNIGH